MIDGFRYGFIGHSDAPLWLGAAVLAGADLLLWTAVYACFRRGWRLKA
jgi:ABC-2 type transport system permease protein